MADVQDTTVYFIRLLPERFALSWSMSRILRCHKFVECINGDRARKEQLIQYGFRLPSALDNRPLRFEEFEERVPQIIYISATPGPYELSHTPTVTEQIIRPTGLLDPPVEVRPIKGQIDDLISEINLRVERERARLYHDIDEEDVRGLDRLLRRSGH